LVARALGTPFSPEFCVRFHTTSIQDGLYDPFRMTANPQAIPHRLLVVEDDAPLRELMKAVFARRGDVVVDCAEDGDAALRMLRRAEYDAVLLDLMLPGANGFDVIRDLKSRSPRLLERTIVLTAASQSTLQHFDDARLLRRLMRKPFDLDDLVAEIVACTDSGTAPAQI
jgi:DNA-binding response OmpR family regulator